MNRKRVDDLAEERSERAKKAGGKKTAARRNSKRSNGTAAAGKKTLRECMAAILNACPDEEAMEALRGMGIEAGELDNAAALSTVLFRKALAGDVSAYKELSRLVGEDDGPEAVTIIDDL